jgi:hypothetical protein
VATAHDDWSLGEAVDQGERGREPWTTEQLIAHLASLDPFAGLA